MRTSNKILLGIFLTAVLIIASIHVALYAKYKSGNFETMKTVRDEEYMKNDLKPVHYIVANGLENFKIIPSDTMRLEIEKSERESVKFSIIGDSLIIHGDSIITHKDGTTDINRSSQQVNLYLSSSGKITVNYCETELKPADDSNKAKSYHFALMNSANLRFTNNDYRDSSYKYINSIFIQADSSSSIQFLEILKIKEANLRLRNSQFEDNNSQIEKLSIDADKKSNAKLSGNNLQILNK
jgi:hypothetical protein